MLIHDMKRDESIDLLIRTRLCRLACVHDGQPYVVPICCAYHDNYLYSFSKLGQKIAWMRANPLVCVEADSMASPQDWATVIVLGAYEELLDTPQYELQRKRVHDLLQRRPVWWEPGSVKTELSEKTHPVEFVYFRIHIDQISGRRGIPDTVLGHAFSATHEPTAGWLRRILGRPEHRKGDH
jgi:nitroimidazol reductase NimA-like FMN-containing flavoprotein (pyridoxamine 5'-phosphate oxidase superfamily)